MVIGGKNRLSSGCAEINYWSLLMHFCANQRGNTCKHWRHSERDGVSNHRRFDCFCSAVCSAADKKKHQSSASLAFVRGIHQSPVDSPHKGPITRNFFSTWWRYHIYCLKEINAILISIKKTRECSILNFASETFCAGPICLTRRGRDKMAAVLQSTFREWKIMNNDFDFTEVCSQGSN